MIEELLVVVKKDLVDVYDCYLCFVVDMENFCCCMVCEKDEICQYVIGCVFEDMILVFDNLGFGFIVVKVFNVDVKMIVGGIGMVVDQLKNVFGQYGLKEINFVGQVFDLNQYEFIVVQLSVDVVEGNVV